MIRTAVRLLLVCTIALTPAAARAQQEATLSGAVIDSSGGVMPGVTITALHESSGTAMSLCSIAVDFHVAEAVDGRQVVAGKIAKNMFLKN